MASRVEIREAKRKKARRKITACSLVILFVVVSVISYKRTIQELEEFERLNTKIDTSKLIRDIIEKNKQKEKMEE